MCVSAGVVVGDVEAEGETIIIIKKKVWGAVVR